MPLPSRTYPNRATFLRALDNEVLLWYRSQYETLLDDPTTAAPAQRTILALINAELARRLS